MAFRRNYSKIENGKIRRLAIFLTIAVFIGAFLIQDILARWFAPLPPNVVSVQFLSDSMYLVERDTTNYDQFASVLRKAVINAQQEYPENFIQITVPATKKVGGIADIIQVANAMNLKVELVTEP